MRLPTRLNHYVIFNSKVVDAITDAGFHIFHTGGCWYDTDIPVPFNGTYTVENGPTFASQGTKLELLELNVTSTVPQPVEVPIEPQEEVIAVPDELAQLRTQVLILKNALKDITQYYRSIWEDWDDVATAMRTIAQDALKEDVA